MPSKLKKKDKKLAYTPKGLSLEDICTLNSLWEDCLQHRPSRNVMNLWEDHKLIYSTINTLMTKLPKFERHDRFEKLDTFLKWAEAKGIESSGIEIGRNNGISLVSTDDKPANLTVIRVPFTAALTTTTQDKVLSLRKLLDKDEMVKSMNNIALAVTLAHELLRGDESPWKPYIDVLPAVPETPLFYDLDQFQNLKPSPLFEDAMRFYRSLARHYVYFYMQIYVAVNRKIPNSPINYERFTTPMNVFVNTPFTPENFTFDLYRWCVATVSTRINMVPIITHGGDVKNEKCAALIPFLDFANHDTYENGAGTLYMRGNMMELYMDKEVQKGQEITLFYGARYTSLYLLHNGFVPSCVNDDDGYFLPMGLPVKGNNYRIYYLSSIGITPFYETEKSVIFAFFLNNSKAPVIRTAIEDIMNHGDDLFLADSYRDGIEGLWKYATTVSVHAHYELPPDGQTTELRKKAQKFLANRFDLLLKSYKDVDGDTPQANDEPLSAFYARRLKAIEQRILEQYVIAISELNCEKIVKPLPAKYKKDTAPQATSAVITEEDTIGTYVKLPAMMSVGEAYADDFFVPGEKKADSETKLADSAGHSKTCQCAKKK